METESDLEPLHTEQVQDIIGKPPIWLYRWGISLVLGIIVLCILISCFIPYPEVIKTDLKIISAVPVQKISIKDSARLTEVLIQNGRQVKKGEILAVAENVIGKITIKATENGELRYVGIVREKEQLIPGQVFFDIISNSGDFYGEMPLSKSMASKVKPGQTVLVNIKNYSGEGQFAMTGKIKYIADNSLKSDEYIAEVNFPPNPNGNKIEDNFLSNGTMANAEIVIAPSTVFHRIIQNLLQGLKMK
jgi:hypothetical protein